MVAKLKSLLSQLRTWRQSSMALHAWASAVVWADKALALSEGAVEDLVALGEALYASGDYDKAYRVLSEWEGNDMGVCHLAAQCAMKLNKWSDAQAMLDKCTSDTKQRKDAKRQAWYMYLKGAVAVKLHARDDAKVHFKAALAHDPLCYEAFHALVSHHMLSTTEGIPQSHFIRGTYHAHVGPEAELMEEIEKVHDGVDQGFLRHLYQSHLSKSECLEKAKESISALETDYGLHGNNDVALKKAHALYIQLDFRAAYAITKKIIDKAIPDADVWTLHFSLLHELKLKNELFYGAHKLVDRFPEHAESWYGMGCYYMSTQKYAEARRAFSKASTIDPDFGLAWIGFAHSFAEDGEHDQAVAAYSTAARLLPGNHLPYMFIGIQHRCMGNVALAEEYLKTARSIYSEDPALENELGVTLYAKGNYTAARKHLNAAFELNKSLHAQSNLKESILCNLGHCARKQKDYDTAREFYHQALLLNPSRAETYTALGLVSHARSDFASAIEYYHKALGLNPDDPLCTDLLNRALEAVPRLGPTLPQFCKDLDMPPDYIHDDSSLTHDEPLVHKSVRTAKRPGNKSQVSNARTNRRVDPPSSSPISSPSASPTRGSTMTSTQLSTVLWPSASSGRTAERNTRSQVIGGSARTDRPTAARPTRPPSLPRAGRQRARPTNDDDDAMDLS